MAEIKHSVHLDRDKCKGCTNCIKNCPTQAIRVQNGKAKILTDKCIDCGECIRICPYHAKTAVTDGLSRLKEFKYNIALPAPTFYGQFANVDSIDSVLNALIQIGFDYVYEVAYAAEIITAETKKLIETNMLETPIINSACPAVVKLITTRFPNLLNNIIPIISPMQLAAKLARSEAIKRTGLKSEEIGIFFITPCAAKATCVKNPIGIKEHYIDGSFSIKDVYLKVLPHLKDKINIEKIARAGFSGVCWATSGGEASANECKDYIAVDGIQNVIKILEEIENNKLKDIKFVELLACTGGCVGGPLNVENAFVAQRRVKKLAEKCEDIISKNNSEDMNYDVMWNTSVEFAYKTTLDDNMIVAMQKLARLEEIYEDLPKLDCGSCGSPTCRCLAEDIVRGKATEEDCIVKFKQKILKFANDVIKIELGENTNDGK